MNTELTAGVVGMTVTGLALAGVLAASGVRVLASDLDEEMVNVLVDEELPGEEPGLGALTRKGIAEKQLVLCPNLRRVIRECPVIFVTCMTPPDDAERPGMRFATSIVRQIASQCPEDRVVVLRLLAGIGTAEKCQVIVDEALSQRQADEGEAPTVRVVTMPALYDDGMMIASLKKDGALAVGCDGDVPAALADVLAGLPDCKRRLKVTDTQTAEAAALAASVEYAVGDALRREMAAVFGAAGIQADAAYDVLSAHRRVTRKLEASHPLSPGYGGSRLSRECKEWMAGARDVSVKTPMVKGADLSHDHTVQATARYLKKALKGIKGPVAIAGLAYAPGTDDLRDSPSVEILKILGMPHADIDPGDPKPYRLYLPTEGTQASWRLFACRDAFDFCDGFAKATSGASALIVLGRIPGLRLSPAVKRRMHGNLIIDAVCQFDRQKAEDLGFDYRLLFES
ncbi:MAG: hypothetical protein IJG85_05220 [Eubacteriaceae bacterium]|nr:hypothetical protein [Eubacteriaceae bacterium]